MTPPSGLCVGLDPDVARMPLGMQSTEHIAPFLSAIVHSTRSHAAAYKINTAFFEQYGLQGERILRTVREAVGESYCILDAKRADIGNTSAAYARALFVDLQADAVTVHPYMGSDSVAPFLDHGFTYLLALTSNPGSADFQRVPVATPTGAMPLYQHVMEKALTWGADTVGFVIGATHPTELAELRQRYPTTPFLIPGIGTQGGDAAETASANRPGPALFNVGRSIIYASSGPDFAEVAGMRAREYAKELA